MVKSIVIFGSTGMTGLCVTANAVAKGLRIKVFLRDPNKLPDRLKKNVEIVQGDVLVYKDVLSGVQGSDRVIVTLGTRNDLSPTTILSDGMRNIANAMKEAGIEIVSVCLSAFLFFDINTEMVPERLKEVTKDHIRMYDVLKESNLKYIAVFAPHISSDPGTGYIVANKYISRKVSKYDLAEFLVDCLEMEQHYRMEIGIASKH